MVLKLVDVEEKNPRALTMDFKDLEDLVLDLETRVKKLEGTTTDDSATTTTTDSSTTQ